MIYDKEHLRIYTVKTVSLIRSKKKSHRTTDTHRLLSLICTESKKFVGVQFVGGR